MMINNANQKNRSLRSFDGSINNRRHGPRTNHSHNGAMSKTFLRTAIASGLLSLCLLPQYASAYRFETEGGITGRFDTDVSFGAMWRMEERDPDLVGEVNGGTECGSGNGSAGCSANGDDGNLNYDQYDSVYRALRIANEFEVNYDNFGAFIRTYAIQDFANDDADELARSKSRQHVGSNLELLDAYAYGSVAIGNTDLGFRIGKQVVNWGEASLIPGGINTNPVDVAKLRTPGGTIEDALTPFSQIWGLWSISADLSIEGWYQLDWQRTEPTPVGTYFSTRDFVSIGGNYVMLGFGTPAAGDSQASPFAVERGQDRTPEDTEQGGLAFRYSLPDASQLALYLQQYHSRIPLISGVSTDGASFKSGSYFEEYPEDIYKAGLGFDTELPLGIILQGEYSYTYDQPLQIDDIELLFNAVGLAGQLGPSPGSNAYIQGFRRFNTHFLDLAVTKLFFNELGADQIIVYAEAAVHRVNGLPSKDELRFEGPGTSTSGGPAIPNHPNNPVTEPDGFADKTSWGYRILVRGEYTNVIGDIDMQPRVVFFHDVNGTSPTPGPGFVEGAKRANVGTTFEIGNNWQFDVGYTWFWGGGYYNRLGDRDNVATFVRYSF